MRHTGVTELEALMVFNLAPLATRRDVAMLGLIHRTVLGKGPEHFRNFFRAAKVSNKPGTRLQKKREQHGQQLEEHRAGTHLNVVRRSALGLTAVYNLLPARVVKLENVKDFQKASQELVKERATEGCSDWRLTFSPRLPLYSHPLK